MPKHTALQRESCYWGQTSITPRWRNYRAQWLRALYLFRTVTQQVPCFLFGFGLVPFISWNIFPNIYKHLVSTHENCNILSNSPSVLWIPKHSLPGSVYWTTSVPCQVFLNCLLFPWAIFFWYVHGKPSCGIDIPVPFYFSILDNSRCLDGTNWFTV